MSKRKKMKRIQFFTAIIIIVLLTNCEDFLNMRPEATIPSSGLDYSKSENIFSL